MTSYAYNKIWEQLQKFEENKQKGWNYLYSRYKAGSLYENEPIGLYFSRLWYSEELYNTLFLLHAIKLQLADSK